MTRPDPAGVDHPTFRIATAFVGLAFLTYAIGLPVLALLSIGTAGGLFLAFVMAAS